MEFNQLVDRLVTDFTNLLHADASAKKSAKAALDKTLADFDNFMAECKAKRAAEKTAKKK